MARGTTIFRFEIGLADLDRNKNEELEVRVAMHPSESPAWLVTRVLAWALNQRDGLQFSRGGLAESEDPPLFVDDLSGQRQVWVELGHPSAERLHQASKAADEVQVWVHRAIEPWLSSIQSKSLHRPEAVEIFELPLSLVGRLADSVQRNNRWELTRTESHLYMSVGGESLDGEIVRHRLGA